MKTYKKFSTLLFILLLSLFSGLFTSNTVAQNTTFSTDDGWGLGIGGQLPVFIVGSNHEGYSADGENQFSTRVMSGFNPANITFNVSAPEYNGISVTGIFQINHHLQGPSIQNEGLFEGRIADIVVSGDFGSLNMGKGLGLFNSNSIGDAGSGMGVGRFAGPDAADATLGRIGSGYTYANFNPRITYTTPDISGLSLKAGAVNPEKPDGLSEDIETSTPRFEGQAEYNLELQNGSALFWGGGMYQNVNVVSDNFEYAISGWDLGVRLTSAGFGLTGAYSETKGVGADGLIGMNLNGSGLDQADVNASQWYAEGTYTAGDVTVGLSYGEGSQDAHSTEVGSSPDITNQLLMGFTRYNVTENLTLLGELQNFESNAQSHYQALILGMQFSF